MTKAVKAMPAAERPKLLAAPPLVEQLRAVKDAEELAAIQRAVDLADEAFEAVTRRIEPGWTETQVAWEIEKYVREHGGDGVSFETIVAAGPWAAMPHAYPRAEKRIEAGEPIIIDMGARIDGYCSDLSRTFVLGKADGQFDKIYDIVLAAQETAEALIRAGHVRRGGAPDGAQRHRRGGLRRELRPRPRPRRRPPGPRGAPPGSHVQGRPGRGHGVHRRAGHLRQRLGRRAHRGTSSVGIYAGIFTPTEAAAVACIYAVDRQRSHPSGTELV